VNGKQAPIHQVQSAGSSFDSRLLLLIEQAFGALHLHLGGV